MGFFIDLGRESLGEGSQGKYDVFFLGMFQLDKDWGRGGYVEGGMVEMFLEIYGKRGYQVWEEDVFLCIFGMGRG